MTQDQPVFTRDAIYCWFTLCPLWERIATDWSMLIWFRLHHNRLYWWLARPMKETSR